MVVRCPSCRGSSAGVGRPIYLFRLGFFIFSTFSYWLLTFQHSVTSSRYEWCYWKVFDINLIMEPNSSIPFGGTDILTQFMAWRPEYLLTTIIVLAISLVLAYYPKPNLNDYPIVNVSPKGFLSGRIGTRVSLTNPRLAPANLC